MVDWHKIHLYVTSIRAMAGCNVGGGAAAIVNGFAFRLLRHHNGRMHVYRHVWPVDYPMYHHNWRLLTKF
jgi:hypothetical protein